MNATRMLLNVLMYFVGIVALGCAGMAIFSSHDPSQVSYLLIYFLLLFGVSVALAASLHRFAYAAGAAVALVVVVAIWAVFIYMDCFPDWRGQLNQSCEIFLIVGIPAAVGIAMHRRPWGRAFSWVIGIAALILMTLLQLATWGEISSLASKSGYSCCWAAAGAMLLVNVGRGDRRYFRWPGVLLAATAIVATFLNSMPDEPGKTNASIVAAITGITAITLAFVNVLLMTKKTGLVRIFKWVAVACAVVAGAAVLLLVLRQMEVAYFNVAHLPVVSDSILARLIDATLSLMMGSTVCMLIARARLRLQSVPTAPAGINAVQFTCPNCHTTATLPLHGACPTCLLRFKISLAEPHCRQCDHLLLNLTSNRCPECGTEIKRPAPQLQPTPA